MQENEKTTNTLHLRREDIENVKCFYKHKAEMLFYTIIEISAFTAVNAMILRSINEFWHLDVLTLLRIYVFAMYSCFFLILFTIAYVNNSRLKSQVLAAEMIKQ